MNHSMGCSHAQHVTSRRQVLASTLGVMGFGALGRPVLAKEITESRKRVLLLFLSGGARQQETKTGKQTQKLVSTFKAMFNQVTLHPKGFLIAAGGAISSGELWFWQTGREKPMMTLQTSGPALDLELSADSRRILVAQSSGKSSYPTGGTVGIYDMEFGT